jgi:hypothetical protein
MLPGMEEMRIRGAHPARMGADQRLSFARDRIRDLANLDYAVLEEGRLHLRTV